MTSRTPLTLGTLVEINGKVEAADYPYFKQDVPCPSEMQKEQGQILDWNEQHQSWVVSTFGSVLVRVKEEFVRPLTAEDVTSFDVALGPMSAPDVLGHNVVTALAEEGKAVAKMFVSMEDVKDMRATAEKLAGDGLFARLPKELETGYLGKGGSAKTMHLEFEDENTPGYVRESALAYADDTMGDICSIVGPHVQEKLGFLCYSRSCMMLALPFSGEEEQDSFPHPELESRETESFISLMKRGKLMCLMVAGQGTVTLTLSPKHATDKEATLSLTPGMIAIVSTDRFRYSYKADASALVLQAWILDAPIELSVEDYSGDMSGLGMIGSGPALPVRDEYACIAGCGMKYPSNVYDLTSLWSMVGKSGTDAFVEMPQSRWDFNDYYAPDADGSDGKGYCKHGGFMEDIDMFDNKFFGISVAEAQGMDPNQRLIMEAGYVALSEGGFDIKMLKSQSKNIAMICGIDKYEWGCMAAREGFGTGTCGAALCVLANRFSFSLNLKGASITIDTACSSSLVATHTAKLYLQHKHFDPCEAVIGGGSNLLLDPFSFVGGCSAGMFSHQGRCFTFNKSADGYARGESQGFCCQKLEKFDKDKHYAVLAGSQVNQDGRSASITAPNGPSQERCFHAVLRETGIQPAEVDAFECHGTGTSLGDPIEVGSFKRVMSSGVPRHEPIISISIKSNFGHCEGSAGISGFMKVIMICQHSESNPNCHINCLNPHLDLEGFPTVFLTEGIVNRTDSSYCSVSSFGFGGTNAHAQGWGQNVLTSRAQTELAIDRAIQQKLIEHEENSIGINGDGHEWEKWDLPERYNAKPGSLFKTEIDSDGTIRWEFDAEEEHRDLGSNYYLSGTFNDWGHREMQVHPDIPGLFHAVVPVGSSGKLEFQVVADEDENMTFFPALPHCTSKAVGVLGPKKTSKDMSWLVKGSPGTNVSVEFFKAPSREVSVSWVRKQPVVQ